MLTRNDLGGVLTSLKQPTPAVVRAALAVDLLALHLIDDVAIVPAKLRPRPDVFQREEAHPWEPAYEIDKHQIGLCR